MTLTYVNTPEYKMQALRLERNRLLTDCDWTLLPSSPLSAEKQDEWKVYRQTLRDMTKTIDVNKIELLGPELKVSSVTWPTKPS